VESPREGACSCCFRDGTAPGPGAPTDARLSAARGSHSTETIDQAAADGFTLEERTWQDRPVWAWRRGDDRGHPMFLSEREAVAYMADRLRRIAVFE
jgi:hypothetical protein